MAEEGMDPSKLFTIWEDDFKNELKGSTVIDGRAVTHVNLYPNQGDEKPFHTIQLFIDEATMEMVRAVVKGREGTDVTYDVTSFKPRAEVSASKFQFNAEDFPGVSIIDNRL
jgi:outer membrane lipoprotein-sorting protein